VQANSVCVTKRRTDSSGVDGDRVHDLLTVLRGRRKTSGRVTTGNGACTKESGQKNRVKDTTLTRHAALINIASDDRARRGALGAARKLGDLNTAHEGLSRGERCVTAVAARRLVGANRESESSKGKDVSEYEHWDGGAQWWAVRMRGGKRVAAVWYSAGRGSYTWWFVLERTC
jgi:hypothetical protein